MRAYLARIHRLNPHFNAIVNLASDDVLLAQAAERDAELARGVDPRLDARHAAGDQGHRRAQQAFPPPWAARC